MATSKKAPKAAPQGEQRSAADAPKGAAKRAPTPGKVERFIAEYLKDSNATQAAIRAGYSPVSAKQQASRLMTNHDVRRQIDDQKAQLLAKVAEEAGISLDKTLREIARVAYFDPRRLFGTDGRPLEITDLDDDTAAVVAGLDVLEEWAGTGDDRRLVGLVKKWKLADKLGALEKLMKHLGGYQADNEQAKPESMAAAMAAFVGQLHQSGAGRLKFAPKVPAK